MKKKLKLKEYPVDKDEFEIIEYTIGKCYNCGEIKPHVMDHLICEDG